MTVQHPALNRPPRTPRLIITIVLAVLSLAASIQSASAQATAPTLGTAKSFGVLGGQGVTNVVTPPSPNTTIHGDLGTWPNPAVTGFPPGQVILPGTPHLADGVAAQAQLDLTDAYNALAGRTGGIVQTDPELGGRTLVAGVYKFGSGQPAAAITGELTLNAKGNANAVFIFQIASTLTTAVNSSVRLINGAQPCNVFWQVGSSATLFTNTSFVGNILALQSIALQNGTSVNGRVLARNASVTLDHNNVFFSGCAAPVTGGGDAGPIAGSGPGPGPINPAPPPDTPPVAGAGPICTDKILPTVHWAEQVSGSVWTATVRDKQSGLASIVIDWATTSNTTVSIPAFGPGITTPIVVTATEILDGPPALFGIKVTDLCGNVTMWDPVEFTMNANEKVTLNGISSIEHFVTITNENIQSLIITINGNKTRIVPLRPDTIRTINIGGAMEPGDDNTITFETVGYGGGKSQVVILVHPK